MLINSIQLNKVGDSQGASGHSDDVDSGDEERALHEHYALLGFERKAAQS
jgi:hypothetical protein